MIRDQVRILYLLFLWIFLLYDVSIFREGGGVILKKKILQGYSEQKNTCTGKLGEKYPALVFGGVNFLLETSSKCWK
jgi:hypothetical protein